jgi:hypothetical protein
MNEQRWITAVNFDSAYAPEAPSLKQGKLIKKPQSFKDAVTCNVVITNAGSSNWRNYLIILVEVIPIPCLPSFNH